MRNRVWMRRKNHASAQDSFTMSMIQQHRRSSASIAAFTNLDPSVIDEGSEESTGNDSEHEDSAKGSGSGSGSGSDDNDVRIGEDESRAVKRVQIFFFLVLFSVALGISTLVFVYSQNRDKNDFRQHFTVHAEKIVEDVVATTARSLRAIEGFALQITIHSIDHFQTWPNVALSDFEGRARVTIDLAEAISLTFIPIVRQQDRYSYEKFCMYNQEWLANGLAVQDVVMDDNEQETIEHLTAVFEGDEALTIPSRIYEVNDDGVRVSPERPYYAPIWQFAPAFPVASMVNLNTLSLSTRQEEVLALLSMEKTIVGKAVDFDKESDPTMGDQASVLNLFLNRGLGDYSYDRGPVSDLYSPIFDGFGSDRATRGMISSYVYWQVYFENVLPQNVNGVIVVLENSCNQSFTFQLNGPNATYLGEGDLHDPAYDNMKVSTGTGRVFLQDVNSTDAGGQCVVNINLYPSREMEQDYLTGIPLLFTIVLGCTFLFTSVVFLWYQRLIDRRQSVVMKAAVQSTAVVQSLFPANVRERLFEENEQESRRYAADGTSTRGSGAMETSLNTSGLTVLTSETIFGSKPIADLFANTTVMFADMVGFTAWASVREPTQVFMLLETTYHSFDMIAKRMRIFKVETVGDCYVAVAGLPTPRKDHALIMAKFAVSIRSKMHVLARELETTLGPDTADLGLRIGMHSGPVTAGVLRGDKGRFQLFGDTINTASRIESTGVLGKIHLSHDTADLLTAAGKSNWVSPREGKVVAKGKGELQTYWLTVTPDSLSTGSQQSEESSSRRGSSDDSTSIHDNKKQTSAKPLIAGGGGGGSPRKQQEKQQSITNAKTTRLIQWNVDVLSRLMKQILARRSAGSTNNVIRGKAVQMLAIQTKVGETVLDEVKDIIELPKFDADTFSSQKDTDNVLISPQVVKQLTDLVTKIALMYRKNPFHNFEHASHVTMSVTKLLSRIVNPAEVVRVNKGGAATSDHKIASDLHDHTFGITSDPLTQFACVFGALIHDLDHPGVSNSVLVDEQGPLAKKYKNKSIAEQNSVDLAWDLLMRSEFDALRCCIYDDMDELKRFRQLLVNVVMATDIMDKDLGALRKTRWEKAFREGASDTVQEDVNRKATIVIEHLIQASDVAHTMQHWHVFRKWNERLFFEMYRAYRDGRLEKDPSRFWYESEMGFFDFYIIPLAKKLETCGVFGVSSDEYLNYACANRREWEEKGESIVVGYVENYIDDDTSRTID